MKNVYGFQNDKNMQVLYRRRKTDDGVVLLAASRFLLEIPANRSEQRIIENRPKTVSFISINSKDEVVWA